MERLHMAELLANRDRRTTLAKFSNFLESWMHRKVAADGQANHEGPILEIGGGTLNHPRFEPEGAPYDVIEPLSELFSGRPEMARIRNLFEDIREIDPQTTYDRIISIATLEHLTDLPLVTAKSAFLLAEDGIFQAGIPSEGGLLWGLSWRLSTAIMFRIKTGLDWSEHMRYEHVNDAGEIIEIIRYFFDEIHVERFPTPFHQFSLYGYISARKPNLKRAEHFIALRDGS